MLRTQVVEASGTGGEGRLEQVLLSIGSAIAAGLRRQQPGHGACYTSSACLPAGAAVGTPVGALALEAAGMGGRRAQHASKASIRVTRAAGVGRLTAHLPASRPTHETKGQPSRPWLPTIQRQIFSHSGRVRNHTLTSHLSHPRSHAQPGLRRTKPLFTHLQ